MGRHQHYQNLVGLGDISVEPQLQPWTGMTKVVVVTQEILVAFTYAIPQVMNPCL